MSVFLDFKKAFDKVWHKGLIFKLNRIGISGSLLKWLENYLYCRQQCVVIQGQKSTYRHIFAGIPQGSVLGPLLFLIYINDICKKLKSIVQLYADDTSLFRVVKNRNIISAVNDINNDLLVIQEWSQQWLVQVSIEKSVSMLISKRNSPTMAVPILFESAVLQNVSCHKHLGLWIDNKFTWSVHVEQICATASKRINMMLSLKYKLPRYTLETIYMSFIRPVFEYSDVVFDSSTKQLKSQLENLQMRAAQIVTGAKRHTSHTLLYRETGWATLQTRRNMHKLTLLHDIVNKKSPQYLIDLIPQSHSSRITRQTDRKLIQQIRCRLDTYKRSFIPSTIDLWNNKLDYKTRCITNKTTFKQSLNNVFGIQPLHKPSRSLFLSGDRNIQIIMSQMRLEFSNLNSHLYNKLCVDSPLCACKQSNETLHHFFFNCSLYAQQRTKFYISLSQLPIVIHPSVNIVLFGIHRESIDDNLSVLHIIQSYIKDTNRFSQ